MRLAAALGAFLLWFAGSPATAAPVSSPLEFSASCSVEGAPSGSRCGTLRVPADRGRPAGRQLKLRFVLVPGQAPGPADPLFYLAGGPGESAVEALPLVLPTLRSVEANREVVFLEQRGPAAPAPCSVPPALI
jgi:hypothetical protein